MASDREAEEPIEIYVSEKGALELARKVERTPEEWRRTLAPEAYHVLREKGTERAFSGRHWDNHEAGLYRCAGCGTDLFASEAKFDSGTGWPSFSAPVSDANVRTESDRSWFVRRTEVLCGRCDGHLGHVFDDGPAPTGLRYCMNSVSLKIKEKDEKK